MKSRGGGGGSEIGLTKRLSRLLHSFTTTNCMSDIFNMDFADIASGRENHLMAKEVIYSWESIVACSPYKVLHFTRYT